MSLKKITKENTPPSAVPYRNVNNPFRFQFVIPGKGIVIEEDKNGICFISADMFGELVAGDNITIDRLEDGRVMISSVSTVSDIAAGQNVTIDIDPDTGTAIINAITGGDNEHYQGIFDTAQDLIDFDTDPETGDYGMIKNVTYSDGGETTWNGQYKYCFYIGGKWTVVDQMLTFTKDLDLLQQFYSVGGSSPVIYLHEIARSGNFSDLNNIPIVATPEVTVEGPTVTATCATEGAEIWYTTDGTMPHVNGTKYTVPITVFGATTFRFVGIKNGMINSLETTVGMEYELQPPTINLDWHDGTITMGNPNVDGNQDPVGTIYYTTDGTTPTNASTLYTGPFVITEGTQFFAIVIDSVSGKESTVTPKSFNKATVNATLASMNVNQGIQNVLVTGNPNKATIYYTSDGTTPDVSSDSLDSIAQYIKRPIYGSPANLKFRTLVTDFVPSDVKELSVGYAKPTEPSIVFDSLSNLVSLNLQGETSALAPSWPSSPNIKVYYTLDGSTPTDQSTLYTGPFQITGNVTVKAVVVAYGQYYSDVSSENIVIVDEPVISMNYLNGEITMSAPAGMDIYYTLDGSTPSAVSTRYTEPIKDDCRLLSRTVKAVAVRGSDLYSAIVTVNYTRVIWELPSHRVRYNYSAGLISAESPGIPNGSETYFAVAAPGADVVEAIYSRYTSPVTLDYYAAGNPQIVIFKACLSGYLPVHQWTDPLGFDEADAPVISVNEDTDLVTISLDGNTANIPLQTNDNTPTLGARIYYTTDGSTPTASSTLYTRPFTLPEGATAIKAITVCYGEWESDVTSEEVGPEPTVDYMYFEAVEANSTVSMKSTLPTAPDLHYSTDGKNFQEWPHTTQTEGQSMHVFDTITLGAVGEKIYLKGYNPDGYANANDSIFSCFVMTGKIAAGGNAQTIVDGDTPTLIAKRMPKFYDYFNTLVNRALVQAPALPATTLVESCYRFMFGAVPIIKAPALPATTLATNCYRAMFYGSAFAMSDDGTTFNFNCAATLPQKVGGTTYRTPKELATWMGNPNGFL